MYRKLVIIALAGVFLLGLAAQCLAASSQGATLTVSRSASDGQAKKSGDGASGKAKADGKNEEAQPEFRRFDARDPRNHIIRPGGLVIRP